METGCIAKRELLQSFGPWNEFSLPPPIAEIAALRAAAWGTPSGPDELQIWRDEWDAVAQHYCITSDGRIVAAIRFTIHETLSDLPHRAIYGDLIAHLPTPVAWISRLVVDMDRRGEGLSRPLDRLAVSEPFLHGVRSIVGTAGSVLGNRFRHDVMLSHGWMALGNAQGTTDLPLLAVDTPMVYACVGPDR